jgi:hypothetical protein
VSFAVLVSVLIVLYWIGQLIGSKHASFGDTIAPQVPASTSDSSESGGTGTGAAGGDTTAPMEMFVDGFKGFLRIVPTAIWLFMGIDTLPALANESVEVTTRHSVSVSASASSSDC